MNSAIERVVIVGGGTAGWLAAARLASSPRAKAGRLSVTLIEAPDIPTIGVGEGTWPTMRATLAAIGIAEGELLVACDASFKQGSRFDGWVTGAADDRYLHPFTAPPAAPMAELLAAWRSGAPDLSFAAAMTPQAHVCDLDLAPRQRAMPDYQGAANYAITSMPGNSRRCSRATRYSSLACGISPIMSRASIPTERAGSLRSRRGKMVRSKAICSSTAPAMRRF